MHQTYFMQSFQHHLPLLTTNYYAGGKKGGRGKGGGGGGRGVRGVDFGLGIGYNPELTSTSHAAPPSRSAAVNSLKTGMMAQFKSNFVAASSITQNDIGRASRPLLPGFVAGGSIGGEIFKASPANTASASAGTTVQNGSQKKAER